MNGSAIENSCISKNENEIIYLCIYHALFNNIFIHTYVMALKIIMVKFKKIGKHCKSIEILHSKHWQLV